jgi:hypothetical protein
VCQPRYTAGKASQRQRVGGVGGADTTNRTGQIAWRGGVGGHFARDRRHILGVGVGVRRGRSHWRHRQRRKCKRKAQQ